MTEKAGPPLPHHVRARRPREEAPMRRGEAEDTPLRPWVKGGAGRKTGRGVQGQGQGEGAGETVKAEEEG